MFGHTPRAKNPFEQEIHIRHLAPIDVKDIETAPMKYVALALVQLREELKSLAIMIMDKSRPVDEYQTQSLVEFNITGTSVINVPAQYESSEIIESIVVTGPPSGTGEILIGDRVWNYVIPTTGILVIAPIRLSISRSDYRQLTVLTGTGQYTLELMGYADTRGNTP